VLSSVQGRPPNGLWIYVEFNVHVQKHVQKYISYIEKVKSQIINLALALFWPLARPHPPATGATGFLFLPAAGPLLILSFALCALRFALTWRMDSM
jgi:hypothetical protein